VPVDKDNNSIYEEDYFSEVYEYEKPSLYNIFKRLKGFNYSLESLNDIVLESISVLEKNNNKFIKVKIFHSPCTGSNIF